MSASEFAIKAAQNESLWRERLARQAASGKTIAAFCREEGVGKSTMSYWRRRLGVAGRQSAAVRAPFLDVGPVRKVRRGQVLQHSIPSFILLPCPVPFVLKLLAVCIT